MAFKYTDNCRTTLTNAVLVGATTIVVDAAAAPLNSPEDPGLDTGVLTLVDALQSPTKIEIITYTGRTGIGPYTLTGVLKGQQGTVDQAWSAGDFCFVAVTAAGTAAFDAESIAGLAPSQLLRSDIADTHDTDLTVTNRLMTSQTEAITLLGLTGAMISGNIAGQHVAYGADAIHSKLNTTTAGTLLINDLGGDVHLGGSADLTTFNVSATTGNIKGHHILHTTAIDGQYTTGPLLIREANLVGVAQSSSVYAPALSFQWGGTTQAQLALESDGVTRLRDGVTTATMRALEVAGFTSTGISDNATATALTIDASQNSTFSGNIEVGNSVGSPNITVQGAATGSPSLQFYQGVTQRAFLEYNDVGDLFNIDADGDILLKTNNITALTLSSVGQTATFSGDVTMASLTSTGIDDNATGIALTLSDTATILGDTTFNNSIYRQVDTGRLIISGGSGVGVGGAIYLYGAASSSPGDVIIGSSGWTVLNWDDSTGILDLYSGITTGKVKAFTIDASQNSTFTGQVNTAAGTTTLASLNIPAGVAKTTPAQGDIWATATDMFAQINGVSKSLFSPLVEDAFDNLIAGAGAGANLNLVSAAGNLLMGLNAGAGLTQAHYNVAIGRDSLYHVTGALTGADNVAIGTTAMGSGFMTTAFQNVAMGKFSLNNISSASNCVAIGHFAGSAITTGINNVALGERALFDSTAALTGADNVAVGTSAMASSSMTTAATNVAIGSSALNAVTTGSINVAIGNFAGDAITTGGNNVAIGQRALYDATPALTGADNVAIGSFSMWSNVLTSANNNVAIGRSALGSLTSGADNISLGQNTAALLSIGNANVIIGANAGQHIVTGSK